MMSKKPFDSSLPGRLGKMTREQLDAESDQYNVEFSGINAATAPNAKPHPPKRRRGRPAKKASERAVRVLVTMRPALLAQADAHAKQVGSTRAGVIQRALESLFKRKRSA
jgi:hypothetical protein